MTINRRELLVALGAGLFSGAISGAAKAAGAGRWVLYVSASDCINCRGWEMSYRDAFVRGLQKNGIGFRNLSVSSLHNVRNAAEWPADLRWIRDAEPQMSGTPWFFVINGGTIERAAIGTEQWEHLIKGLAA